MVWHCHPTGINSNISLMICSIVFLYFLLIICQAQFDSILLGVLLNDTIISANINVIPTDTSTSSSTDQRISELQRECVHAYAAAHTTTTQLRLLDQFLGVSGAEGLQTYLYFRDMGKSTPGSTQGQYSIVVGAMFFAFLKRILVTIGHKTHTKRRHLLRKYSNILNAWAKSTLGPARTYSRTILSSGCNLWHVWSAAFGRPTDSVQVKSWFEIFYEEFRHYWLHNDIACYGHTDIRITVA